LRQTIDDIIRDFISNERQHMAMEERIVFPAVLNALRSEDWADIALQLADRSGSLSQAERPDGATGIVVPTRLGSRVGNFLIPAFSFQGSDSLPGMILAKQRPKFPAALREPLAKLLLQQDRQYWKGLAL
jgi:hypothetical protein